MTQQDQIEALLEPIRERLAAATPGPWANYGDLGHEIYRPNLDDNSEPESIASDIPRLADARLIANAPTDLARLLAAVQAVTGLPHEDYCCTKGCPGFGLATCGKVHKNGDECDGSECSCFMSGPLLAIAAALEGVS